MDSYLKYPRAQRPPPPLLPSGAINDQVHRLSQKISTLEVSLGLEEGVTMFGNKSKPKSLETIAMRKGIITAPTHVWENHLVNNLRQILVNRGLNYCGGGFVQLERVFRSIDADSYRYISRDQFRRVIAEITSGRFQPNQADEIFNLFNHSDTNLPEYMIDFDFFFLCIRVCLDLSIFK